MLMAYKKLCSHFLTRVWIYQAFIALRQIHLWSIQLYYPVYLEITGVVIFYFFVIIFKVLCMQYPKYSVFNFTL